MNPVNQNQGNRSAYCNLNATATFFCEHIKQTAQSALKKMDEAYDKFGVIGCMGFVAIPLFMPNPSTLVFLAAAVSTSALYLILEYRHRSFLDNKSLQKFKAIDLDSV